MGGGDRDGLCFGRVEEPQFWGPCSEGYIMSHQVVLGRPGVYRILLEQRPEGTYVNVFEKENSPGPYKDWLQDDLEMAMRVCEQEFGVKRKQLREVPDEVWH